MHFLVRIIFWRSRENSTFFSLVFQASTGKKLQKNKSEGTTILKLAIVKKFVKKFLKKFFNKNSSKNSSKKFFKKFIKNPKYTQTPKTLKVQIQINHDKKVTTISVNILVVTEQIA